MRNLFMYTKYELFSLVKIIQIVAHNFSIIRKNKTRFFNSGLFTTHQLEYPVKGISTQKD